MRRMVYKSCIYFLLITICIAVGQTAYGRRINLTSQLQYLGNPYSEFYPAESQIYARNIWDMIDFKGKIYLGAGNSSNFRPAPNAGPVPIISYDPKTGSFASSFVTSDEQIDVFYEFNKALYVPGHDPKESWELGNLYKTVNGKVWLKKRTIPHGVHTFCLTFFNDRLFAGLGTAKGAAIAISDDLGDSWEMKLFPKGFRFYEFFRLGNRLYSFGILFHQDFNTAIYPKEKLPLAQVVEYSQEFTTRHDLNSQTLFPGTPLNSEESRFFKITRSQSLGDKAIYIGAYLHNDMHGKPFGLYFTDSLRDNSVSVKKISMPFGGIPWDTFKSSMYVYVLTNKIVGEKVEVTILRSSDLEDWTELFYFESSQIVRSFVLLQGSFYFSLGCEIMNPQKWERGECDEETGKVYKIDLYSTQ